MGELINGYNSNIPNFSTNLNNDKAQNEDESVNNQVKEEKNTDNSQQVSQEAALDFLSQMGNISMAQINMVSTLKNKSSQNVPELIGKMLEDLSTEVIKGLTVSESIEDSMLTFESLVDKATLILNNEFGDIAQFDKMSEADKHALAAQFVLNMFMEN